MKFFIFTFALLATIQSQEIKLNDAHALEQNENNLAIENNVYDTNKLAAPASLTLSPKVYEKSQRLNREMKMKQQMKKENKLKKKAVYEPKNTKLKFRNYNQELSAAEKKLMEPLAKNTIDGEDFPLHLNKRDEKNTIDEHLDLGEEFEGVEVGDASDGFSFKNLMPVWKPSAAIGDPNKKQPRKSLKKSGINHKADKANYLLLPTDQDKMLLIKTSNGGKNRFDNLQKDNIKVIEINGKSDLKLDELFGENASAKKKINDAANAEMKSDSKQNLEKSKSKPSGSNGTDGTTAAATPTTTTKAMTENNLKEEILSCTAEKLEKYIKNLRNNADKQQKLENSQSALRKLKTVQDGFYPKKSRVSSAQAKSSVPFAPKDLMLEEMLKHLTNADLMHLNITINGLVMKDEKPSHIEGNATIHLNPTKGENNEERRRRGIFSKSKPEPNKDKKECHNERYSKPACCPEDLSRNQMNTLQISNEINRMVSQMVSSNPEMKRLWPSLKRNKPYDNAQSAETIKKLCKGPERKRMEEMIRRALSSVDEIIEQEVMARSCTVLPPDLQSFYELILSLHAKQAKRLEEREERLKKMDSLDEEKRCDDDEEHKSCDDKNCDDEADLNENSLYDMIHERKLKFDNEMAEVRRSREAVRRNRDLEVETANSSLVRRLREGYSPAFLKLHEYANAVDRAATVGRGEVMLRN